MVIELAFYSDNWSLNPAKVYIFSVKLLMKRTKKEPGFDPILIKKTTLNNGRQNNNNKTTTTSTLNIKLFLKPD